MRCTFRLVALTVFAVGTSLLQAQGPPRCKGATAGQWLGPYQLQEAINGEEGAGPYPTPRFSEITHAMLLPPPTDGWILMWCARYCNDIEGAAIPPFRTFRWHPDDPTSVLHIQIPSVSPEGSGDLFCAGQTFSADGDPVVFGGTDLDTACPNGPIATGHSKVFLFQNANSSRTWVLNSVDMLRERWYPTAVLLPSRRILVGGHTGEPDYVTLPTSFTRERGVVETDSYGMTGVSWDPQSGTHNFKNWLIGDGGSCTKINTLNTGILGLPDYAQLHVLRDGTLYCIAIGRHEADPEEEEDLRSAVLDFDRCPSDTNEPERWERGPELDDELAPKLEGSPSIHIIDARSGTPTEILYAIAGNEDEGECDESTTNRVLVITDPDPDELWSEGPELE
jgi:hypothetical protein